MPSRITHHGTTGKEQAEVTFRTLVGQISVCMKRLWPQHDEHMENKALSLGSKWVLMTVSYEISDFGLRIAD